MISVLYRLILLAAIAALSLSVKSEPLRFLTFNIWGDYFNNPVAEREKGVEATILNSRADVVALQEVTPNWYKSQMFLNLAKAGYEVVRGDEAAALRRAAFTGNPTKEHINHEPLLYRKDRLKMLESGTEFFHLTLQTSKSVTWLVLEDKETGRRFAAFGTHFWWQHNGKESNAIRELNARHILWILADIRRKWGVDLPTILGGDLNSHVTSTDHAMLRSGGFVNAASDAKIRSTHCSHHGNPVRGEDGKWRGSLQSPERDKAKYSIDHIYYTNGIRALRHEIVTDQIALDVSDHSPVLVEFDLLP
jgi:endonuclease/exonuclease/phosphatase family metal-dependent hydrolase